MLLVVTVPAQLQLHATLVSFPSTEWHRLLFEANLIHGCTPSVPCLYSCTVIAEVLSLNTAAGQKRKRAEDQAAAAVGLKRSNMTTTPEGQADPPDGVPQAAVRHTAAASDVGLP